MLIRAGLLTEPIDIMTSTITENRFGEETEEWNLKYHTKARLIHVGGNREIQNSDIFYASRKTFEVRIYVPVDDYDRIIWNDKWYRILNIDPNKDLGKKIISVELIND